MRRHGYRPEGSNQVHHDELAEVPLKPRHKIGKADSHDTPDHVKIDIEIFIVELEPAPAAENYPDTDKGADSLGGNVGYRCSADTEFRENPQAEYQEGAESDVEKAEPHRDFHGIDGIAGCLHDAFAYHPKRHGDRTDEEDTHVGGTLRDNFRFEAEKEQDFFGEEDADNRHHHREGGTDDKTLPRSVNGAAHVPGPDVAGHHRPHTRGHAHHHAVHHLNSHAGNTDAGNRR